MDIIHLLSDRIANQIAAGEVVQRPSSVVKELLENAIDAQSKNIKLVVKDSGKMLVQVIDDGLGMSGTDCRMCFERHATSKISKSDDLYAIRTMGFRGEALSSIAAVAQVEIKTRREEDELGTQLRIEGSEYIGQEPISTPQGTNLMVKNIFFNVPARRKFLKSNSVEMKHILDEFQKVALAYPEVAFEMHHNDVELYRLVSENLAKRIVDLFGKNYRQQLAHCEEFTPYINISGYVGKPESAKKARGDQYFFINRRFIKSNYLHHAITTAFEGTIAEGYHPFYVLNIEIDPSHIDINIHPQKTEIKFDDERAVYGILRSAVRQAIGVYNLTPSIDFESDINFGNLTNKPLPEKSPSAFEKSVSAIQNFERKDPHLWKPLYEGLENATNRQDKPGQISIGSKANQTRSEAESESFKPETEEVEAIQIHLKFLVIQVKSGMLLIDQKAAWERILFEQYLKNLQNKSGASQQLLFQKTVELDPSSFDLAQELKAEIHALGFAYEIFGKTSLIIHGIPVELNDEDGAKTLKDLIAQYKENEAGLNLNKTQNLAQSLAKRAAHKQIKVMDKREMRAMINRLFESTLPNYTPDGQKVMKIIPLSEMAELISKTNGF